MSVKVSAWVWEYSDARGNDLLILLALADIADDAGVCWPSLALLSSKTKLHENTVRARLKSLKAAGLVEWERRPGTSNRFRINTDTPLKISAPTPTKNGTPTDFGSPTPWAVGDPYQQLWGGRGTPQGVGEPSMNHQDTPDEFDVEDVPAGTRTAQPIPRPFVVTSDMRQWAGLTAPSIEVDDVTRTFVAYWAEGEGRGKKKKNWPLTWQNWLKRTHQDNIRRGWKPTSQKRRFVAHVD